ncbi:hypothetical protein R1flu_004777 [Riccia fluitans]|uniref:Uncharacterized protein n=1 Tax=Riccia fluitans TaxID=41844 RepID=A0ABD1YRK4_9MARC
MGPNWDPLAPDIVPASQVMEDRAVKSTARVLSLFQTLVNRQRRPSKVFHRPYEGEWTSDGEKKGGGKRREGQMLAVADEEVYVSVFNTDTYLPSMADCYSKTRDLRSKLWMAHTNAVFDVCWTKDDTHILTASGNQTIRL